MTNEFHAILLVPTDGDPGGLLTAGPLFAMPPVVMKAGDVWSNDDVDPFDAAAVALPLWWDGALIAEGWDRARRVWLLGRASRPEFEEGGSYESSHHVFPTPARVLAVARALEAAGLCRVVVLDLVDGAVVERAP